MNVYKQGGLVWVICLNIGSTYECLQARKTYLGYLFKYREYL